MVSDTTLLVAARKLPHQGIIATALLTHVAQPAKTSDVKGKAHSIGMREAGGWNFSLALKRASDAGWVAQLPEGWSVLPEGVDALRSYGFPIDAPMISEIRHSLRSSLLKVSDPERHAFIEEAIGCFESNLWRAAVVLSWVGAAHIMQTHVIAQHLSAFNAAGAARFPRDFKAIKSIKDFAAMNEASFLQICQDGSILSKAEKQELEERLGLRNRCGHPNTISIKEHAVANHLEILMLNVYSRY